jgi:chemotaxis response regulator CheB
MGRDDTISIVLADDHAVVRRGLRLVLDGEEGLEVLAEAGTVDDAVRLVKAHRPDVVVLDLNMPGSVASSLDILPALSAEAPDTRVARPPARSTSTPSSAPRSPPRRAHIQQKLRRTTRAGGARGQTTG